MKYYLSYILCLISIIFRAQDVVQYNDTEYPVYLTGSSIYIFEDKIGDLKIKDVLRNREFKKNVVEVPNLGVSASSFWLKVKINNISKNEKFLLKLAYPNLNEVECYQLSGDSILSEQKLGKYKPFNQRNYNDPAYIFDLNISRGQTNWVFIKIKSGGQIMVPLLIGNSKVIFEITERENLFIGIYIGAILIMFFYNLFIYYTVRDKVYLNYVVYILSVGLVQMCLLGHTFQWLWPYSPWMAKHSVYLLSALVGITSIEFVKVFLRTKEFTPKLQIGFYVLTAIYLVYIVLDLFNLSEATYNIIQLCAMLLSLYMLFVGYRISKKKYRPANYFLLAWSLFLLGVFVYALKDVGVLPYDNYTVYMMPVGSVIEAALLSFALADRINALKKENERIITGQKDVLEIKVKERTKELEETREQLVNAEKMASLGQLTAGISHEINNPINFVVSNVQPLKRDIAEILQVLDKYSEINTSDNIDKTLAEVATLKKNLDLDFLVTEINLLLKGIEEGSSRTSEIVKGLKNFSRIHEVEFQFYDIHQGLDSTLSILNNNISSSGIRVIKQYGQIPQIECFPGRLNQVFMNLLNNAIQAISAKKLKNGEGQITIVTRQSGPEVEVRIKDNGIGIPKSKLTKVFEPFYTTKDVGAGTGLGLSIVYGIIGSHNGTITVASEENEGAEFIILLPVKQAGI